MGMTVSIEWFVAQNLGMNALTLLLAARLAGIRTGKGRVLAAAALGCAYAVAAYLPWGRFLLGLLPRTAVCAGMTLLLCAGPRVSCWKRTLRVFAFVWVATLLLGGTGAGVLYLLGASGYGPGAAAVTAVLGGAALLVLSRRKERGPGSPTALLTVRAGGRRVSLPAVVDTGNVLVEPVSNLPVIVVERRALQGLEAGRRPRPVPFTSVGGSGILPAFAADAVRVDGREVEAYIAVYDGALSEEGQALIPGRCVR
ncbi:MAG TPA: sigma-E processing peptidase SpoIIGA [Candidatus Spyradocola merdavium]|nr:sigma-E processing peptidase SpoIIGA [Candidatus Spyradocola merdavium]